MILPRSATTAIWAIHQDRTGAIWAGTQTGLNRLDLRTGKFTHYLEKDGLPNSSVTCIQEDEGGNLWLSTNNGLVRVNPILMRFRIYDVSHGLQSNEFDSGACMRSRNGEMFFGGVRGFNVFRPNEIPRQSQSAAGRNHGLPDLQQADPCGLERPYTD